MGKYRSDSKLQKPTCLFRIESCEATAFSVWSWPKGPFILGCGFAIYFRISSGTDRNANLPTRKGDALLVQGTFVAKPLRKREIGRSSENGRQCANSPRADSTTLSYNPEESSGRAVSTISHHATGSRSSGGAMVREAGLRMCVALCRQSNSAHPQFHPNHRSTRRCAVDRAKHKTPQTICSSSSS